ncbi:MAG: hypothetical protein IKU34_07675 [Clostridia bacterium]|nr:hypothetical protein [Clostridia bacterium]
MKKRCTNSSCRKVFSVNAFSGSCPYCAKTYPRLTPHAQLAGKSDFGFQKLLTHVTMKELKLSQRTTACLERMGYRCAADILLAGVSRLKRAPGFGQTCFLEVVNKLNAMGFDSDAIAGNNGAEYDLGSAPIPQSVFADHRDTITLCSGKHVSVAPLCVNGVYLPMGKLFKQLDEILSDGDMLKKRIYVIKAIRGESLRLTGNRAAIGLRECVELFNYMNDNGHMPSAMIAHVEYVSGSLYLRNAAFTGKLNAPSFSQLGKTKNKR